MGLAWWNRLGWGWFECLLSTSRNPGTFLVPCLPSSQGWTPHSHLWGSWWSSLCKLGLETGGLGRPHRGAGFGAGPLVSKAVSGLNFGTEKWSSFKGRTVLFKVFLGLWCTETWAWLSCLWGPCFLLGAQLLFSPPALERHVPPVPPYLSLRGGGRCSVLEELLAFPPRLGWSYWSLYYGPYCSILMI